MNADYEHGWTYPTGSPLDLREKAEHAERSGQMVQAEHYWAELKKLEQANANG